MTPAPAPEYCDDVVRLNTMARLSGEKKGQPRWRLPLVETVRAFEARRALPSKSMTAMFVRCPGATFEDDERVQLADSE